MTVSVLKELGLPSDNLRSKGIDEVGVRFDFVITLCDVAREDCPPFPSKADVIHWSLPDPAGVSGPYKKRLAAFRSTAHELADRIDGLLQLIGTEQPKRKSRVGGDKG